MTLLRSLCALACGAALACAPAEGAPDAAAPAPDGGAPDAGAPDPKPLPFPVAKMDKPQAGTNYRVHVPGVVSEHGPNRVKPAAFGDAQPARRLALRLADGSTIEALYYTLPEPFAFAALPGASLDLLYREAPLGFETSAGARLLDATGKLVVLFEDGVAGPAFDDDERLGITFALDLLELTVDEDPCGRKVGYPMRVTVGGVTRRLFPGETFRFALSGGDPVDFTLLDAYRIEDAVCSVPEFSVAYLVRPAR
jgi:hypothetical protein